MQYEYAIISDHYQYIHFNEKISKDSVFKILIINKSYFYTA